MAPVLRLNDLCREYRRGDRRFLAVDHVSLDVEAGSCVSVIGRSGSGKSTLLNLAAGMLSPTAGSVELLGQNLADLVDARLSRLRCDAIGFIPQGPSALPGLTVLENVLLPFVLWPHGGDGEGAARLLLSRFGIEGLADAYPEDLSGGELRRALIARALVNRPSIVIADEPTSDLDAVSRRGVMECLAALQDDGTTLLVVSHDLDTLDFADRVYTMADGRLTEGNGLS